MSFKIWAQGALWTACFAVATAKATPVSEEEEYSSSTSSTIESSSYSSTSESDSSSDSDSIQINLNNFDLDHYSYYRTRIDRDLFYRYTVINKKYGYPSTLTDDMFSEIIKDNRFIQPGADELFFIIPPKSAVESEAGVYIMPREESPELISLENLEKFFLDGNKHKVTGAIPGWLYGSTMLETCTILNTSLITYLEGISKLRSLEP